MCGDASLRLGCLVCAVFINLRASPWSGGRLRGFGVALADLVCAEGACRTVAEAEALAAANPRGSAARRGQIVVSGATATTTSARPSEVSARSAKTSHGVSRSFVAAQRQSALAKSAQKKATPAYLVFARSGSTAGVRCAWRRSNLAKPARRTRSRAWAVLRRRLLPPLETTRRAVQ